MTWDKIHSPHKIIERQYKTSSKSLISSNVKLQQLSSSSSNNNSAEKHKDFNLYLVQAKTFTNQCQLRHIKVSLSCWLKNMVQVGLCFLQNLVPLLINYEETWASKGFETSLHKYGGYVCYFECKNYFFWKSCRMINDLMVMSNTCVLEGTPWCLCGNSLSYFISSYRPLLIVLTHVTSTVCVALMVFR